MPKPPEIVRGGSKAFYSPATDCVTLPPRELFISGRKRRALCCMNALTLQVRESASTESRSLKPQPSIAGILPELVAEFWPLIFALKPRFRRSPEESSGLHSRLAGEAAERMAVMAGAQAQKAAEYILNHRPSAN